MRSNSLILLVLTLLTLLSACVGESYEERCYREALQYTERYCPRRVDSCTVMDSMTYDKSERILHHWYLVQRTLDNDSVYTDEFKERFHDVVEDEIRGSVAKREQKERGTTFIHHYVSERTGKEYFQIIVGPDDYNDN